MALTKVHNRMIDGSAANILDYGADSTGATDSTTEIQAALNSGAKSVYVPPGTYLITALTITSEMVVYGEGKLIRNAVAYSPMINITASNVEIDGLKFDGAGAGSTIVTGNSAEVAVQATGTNSTSQITNIKIRNTVIDGVAGVGIRCDYANNCIIGSNIILNCGYAGILCLSIIDSVITKNRINNIDASSGPVNWYGITLTRDPTATTTLSARSANCIVTENTISNVVRWTGIDFHAANKCVISNNNVYYCKNGIYAQYVSSSASCQQPSEDILITDNLVEGRPDAKENELGIASIGLTDLPNQRIVISDNLLIGAGSWSNPHGAIYVTSTNHAEVKDNTAEKCIRVGISISGTSQHCTIASNKINGVKAGNLGASAFYIYEDHGDPATGFILTKIRIQDNVFVNTTGASNYTPTIGIFYANPSMEVIHSRNRIYTLSGANYLQKLGPTNNLYTDLAWELENESIQFNYATTGGAATETLGDKTASFRRLPATDGAFIYRTLASFDNLTSDPEIAIRGNNGNIYTPLIYTVDGSTIGAGKAINNVVYALEGVYWQD